MAHSRESRLSAAPITRLTSVALALAGIGVVLLFPGNLSVAAGAAAVTATGLWLLSGITVRTSDPRAEQIIEEHKLLVESVERSPIMFAVYDREDYLIAANESYEKLYADVFDELRRGDSSRRIHYSDLIRSFSARTVPAEEMEDYIAERCRIQAEADGTAVDRHYDGFGWLRVTKFATPSGAVAGFAVDINELKERESALNAQIEKSKTLENQLRELANTDPLTGLPNRRAFLERLETEFRRVGRYGGRLSVIMMDIDSFKSINDVHGHSFGDKVIARIAVAAASALRTSVDLIGRLGGEEFAVLLPATGVEGAGECAERMRHAVADIPFETGGESVRITASFGIAAMAVDDGQGSDVVSRADSALYRAKAAGRNRVVAWQDVEGKQIPGVSRSGRPSSTRNADSK
jgi:diguanylate cyclase (GGDEF)-like protein